jgi:UDP-N-acetylmuramyl pentapeptide phosphotransferase/UDP-N-acetylglucosamine-1-phosphate transferase
MRPVVPGRARVRPATLQIKKIMFSFLVSFVASAFLTLLVIKHARLHGPALDADFGGVQKVHAHEVARIGGLPIFLAVVISSGISIWRVPAMATMAAALLGYYLLDAKLDRIDIWFGSIPIAYAWAMLPLTVLAVAGIANAVNIIDGFNGLASVVTICMLVSLAYVAAQVGDVYVLVAALMVAGATAGFLIWNYPVGLIFLGDGGAYFIGFMLGELALLLVMRNPQVSTWYAALLLIYPAFETLFSAYRRMFLRGKSPAMPDGIHLHSLIFRRIVQWAVGRREARALMRRNSLTSPYLWLFSLMAVIPATVFWRNTGVLIFFCLLFVVSYVWLYARIVRFKSPRWLIWRKKD